MTRAQREFFVFAYKEYERALETGKDKDKYQKLKDMIKDKKDGRT